MSTPRGPEPVSAFVDRPIGRSPTLRPIRQAERDGRRSRLRRRSDAQENVSPKRIPSPRGDTPGQDADSAGSRSGRGAEAVPRRADSDRNQLARPLGRSPAPPSSRRCQACSRPSRRWRRGDAQASVSPKHIPSARGDTPGHDDRVGSARREGAHADCPVGTGSDRNQLAKPTRPGPNVAVKAAPAMHGGLRSHLRRRSNAQANVNPKRIPSARGDTPDRTTAAPSPRGAKKRQPALR